MWWIATDLGDVELTCPLHASSSSSSLQKTSRSRPLKRPRLRDWSDVTGDSGCYACTEEVQRRAAGGAKRLVREARAEDHELSMHQAVQRIGSQMMAPTNICYGYTYGVIGERGR
jgi:hypothetical protein